MRITNSMMLNTNKSNINTNKINMDTLSTQLATQKKIQKPSEDPIVAIRSLRLRKNVSELEQYYEKNIKDAESWLSVTESSINNMSEILQDMYYDCTKGANGDLGLKERNAILEDLDALCREYYSEGNATYAGRTIFTGYKTDTNFTFLHGDADASYQIEETFNMSDIKSVSYVSQKVTIDAGNVESISAANTPQINEVYSFSLTYTGVENLNSLSYVDENGETQTIPLSSSAYATDDAYLNVPENGAMYIAETSEIIFGSEISNTIKNLGADAQLTANYNKTGFDTGDINPVFYFNCTDLNTDVEYTKENQAMEYQVTSNQYLKVNTQADEVLNLNVLKDIRRLRNTISNVSKVEDKVKQLEDMLESSLYSEADKENIESMLEATNKELDLQKSIMQDLFEAGVDDFQQYQDEVEVQKTDLGNRSARLNMIKERTSQQLTTFNELLTDNEDVNLSDIILNSTAAQYAYQLSLQAVGSISQLSLMNYI